MKFKKYLLPFLLLVLLLLPVLFFAVRNNVLNWAFNREKFHVKELYHANLNTEKIEFNGLMSIHLASLVLQQDGADTLLLVKDIEFTPVLSYLFFGKLKFDKLLISGLIIHVQNEEPDNYHNFLSRVTGKKESNVAGITGYNERLLALKAQADQLLDMHFDIKDIHFDYRDTGRIENIYCPELKNDSSLSGYLIYSDRADTISVRATKTGKSNSYSFSIQHSGTGQTWLPFLDKNQGFNGSFHSITASVAFTGGHDQPALTTNIFAEGMEIQHWRLARNKVSFRNFRYNGTVNVLRDAIQLDSSSLQINSLPAKLFARYERKPVQDIILNLQIAELPSDTFFCSLPSGVFTTVKGISCTGTLSYNLQFHVNASQPDSLLFESNFKTKNFRINHFGEENFTRINDPFVLDIYDKDNLVRRLEIGPGNPMFTTLGQINHWLPTSILQSEDPSFMTHRGFISEAFRESIIKNYKEQRFARGGSTISMQLVKNVFLRRDKTVSRKAEEALDVYLIENLGLVSKGRMMEIYLNAIEWGPGIYGVGEASHFYFNKRPSELTLPESIFLAWLIPNPKFFKYQFDKEGNIKPYFADYFHLILQRMVSRGLATEAETEALTPNIKITGAARRLILPGEEAPAEETGGEEFQ